MSPLKKRLLGFLAGLPPLWPPLLSPLRNFLWSLGRLHSRRTSKGQSLEWLTGERVFLMRLLHCLRRATWVRLALLKKANDALLQGLFVIRTDEGRDSNTYEHQNKLSEENFTTDHLDLFQVSCINCYIARSNYPWASVWVAGGFHCLFLFSVDPWQQQRFLPL